MSKMIYDYYSGFEGEPEIQFVFGKEEEKVILKLWIGYFDKIMSQLKPKAEGWNGLAYYYHLEEGWFDENPWQIPNIKEAINQLSEIDKTKLEKKVGDILNDILRLLKLADSENKETLIIYD